MQRIWVTCACLVATLLTSACDSLERRYFREGIGTELSSYGLPEATRLQDVYIGYICRQAGLPVVVDGDYTLCAAGFGPTEWSLFFQAGMNDIDRRCDAYLAWLDDKRRSREPVLKQIADMGAATAAIMGATNVGATPISIVGIAFGLAASTFTNVTSRLLLDVDHSTVQTVVLGNQADFRARNSKIIFDNRPAAIYLLRNYLRLCMPFSIEMSINTTVTVYHRDPAGLATEPILLRTPVASRLQTAHALRESIPAGGSRGTLPGTGGQPGGPPKFALVTGGNNATERDIPKIQFETIQANLCVDPTGNFDKDTREAIRQAKIGARQSRQAMLVEPPFNNTGNEIKSRSEVQIFLDARNCSNDSSGVARAYLTAFEKFRFPDQAAINDLRRLLNACGNSLKESESFDQPMRNAIATIKAKAPVSERAKFGDPNSTKLNDKSYEHITRTCIP